MKKMNQTIARIKAKIVFFAKTHLSYYKRDSKVFTWWFLMFKVRNQPTSVRPDLYKEIYMIEFSYSPKTECGFIALRLFYYFTIEIDLRPLK